MGKSPYHSEGLIYDLTAQANAEKTTTLDHIITKAVYETKQHLGPLGMIEVALVVARELALTQS